MFGIFAIFPAIRSENKLPQTFFPQKFTPEWIFSTLISLHKTAVLSNCICSITTCLFRSEIKWLKWCMSKTIIGFCRSRPPWYCLYVFSLHVLNKNDNVINDLSGTSWKMQKLIPSKKNQSVLIAKISSRKIQKLANPQMKINARKSFVAHDIGQNQFEIILT